MILTVVIAGVVASQSNVQQSFVGRLVPEVGYLIAIPAVIYGHRTLQHQYLNFGRTPSTRIVRIGLRCGYIALGLALLATPQAIIGPF